LGVFLIPDRVFEARMTTLHFGHDCRLARLLQAFVAALLLTSLSSGIGLAQDPGAQRGRSFALANCARCHSIDEVSPSPLAIAPPFRTLHQRYPVESLEEALGEGIVTSHFVQLPCLERSRQGSLLRPWSRAKISCHHASLVSVGARSGAG
jgi:hypothetical protein